MMGIDDVQNLFVIEKRQGQEYLGFYLPEGKRELFKDYCQFIDSTMRNELEKFIDECISDSTFQQYLEMKRKLKNK
ncbi:hypothetical protein PN465_10755 [Nodularia spumigena CS-584]|jgi:hypothetical protein|uniref:hypothetical protein n=1 Tax=Cyanophyceae TaxID=3028117 RepID=UPI0000EAC7A6|nr:MULTISPECIES: hypothetical protein [Cyanophyceae]MDB9354943.1 hypothetical protein [Nodularia spumigena CS-587/03]AHJ29150.1 hypothetical protein NSP_28220 [Nodularia spumigena CCY9414]EAW45885.1 hypothetical protein N9414_15822 [Nodularia spumigena CCY9414]MDB9303189.1 hypothetical protein [Nodularia spumigena CS-591/12]MDB9317189.1 hypothetical protein [Nodularia spumigena CS-590/01A]